MTTKTISNLPGRKKSFSIHQRHTYLLRQLRVKGRQTEKFRVKVNNSTRKTRSHESDDTSI